MTTTDYQSSGKSSVLESIVGKDFLPRGSGIVTRRPLVLQLHRIDGTREYAEFLHQPKKSFTDFAEVMQEIADETDRETGRSKTISSVPIHLSIFSPNVVNLTLIDLPGLTKVAVEGQSDTIVQDIENMVRAFIEKPNCIILAVCPANQDLATSDAIKISREVDPKGERTFGVLTKVDVMDEGSDTVNILEGRACQFQFPWTGVVNRSQEDINVGVGMIAARLRERDYFASTPEYKHLAHRMGTENLVRSLSKFLEFTIKSRIPSRYLFTNSSINTEVPKKNRLQGYTLRAYGTFPLYQLCSQGEPHCMTFGCTVQVQGQNFVSATHHLHRKDAEEDAASVACSVLMGNETSETLLDMIKMGSVCKISLLKEYALRKKLVEPLYGSSKVADESQMTLWLSTVTLGSRTFFGDVARSKRCSAQNAASAAAVYLLEDGDEVMIKVLRARRLKVMVSRKKSRSDADGSSQVRKKRKDNRSRPPGSGIESVFSGLSLIVK